ncbi:hypothetical protein GMOD_00004935 [Pyrenophora seminiperda CCB06]|uniref:Uncharacterized protein n=1 Tax=Pyrenophora seminiperda CCB06 TaxID=1302712 RepID=A0A3M7MHS2_9PLEO|nr:hypothetical protein GMOD_00004935 [Pyrenophora seminiperda CCB06]
MSKRKTSMERRCCTQQLGEGTRR